MFDEMKFHERVFNAFCDKVQDAGQGFLNIRNLLENDKKITDFLKLKDDSVLLDCILLSTALCVSDPDYKEKLQTALQKILDEINLTCELLFSYYQFIDQHFFEKKESFETSELTELGGVDVAE